MDLSELPLFSNPSPDERSYLTVAELTAKIRGALEPPFRDVWVQGEVSNCSIPRSGHLYFSLKDQETDAMISVVSYGWAKKIQGKFEIEDGLHVLCRGRVTTYGPRSSYQVLVEKIEPLGAGALALAFEQLKAKLSAEGLFANERKRSLPLFPTRIAIITSPTGAVIQDMLNILSRRAPHIKILVIPVPVQGEGASAKLIRGIEVANSHNLGDVVVLARGGGSTEDLWCFNDEGLARAITQSKLPVVSAVGHEVDFTIADFVADLRAPTPSAAAEIISAHWVDCLREIRESEHRIRSAIERDLANRKRILSLISARLVSPRYKLREQAQRCDEIWARLENSIRARIDRRRAALEAAAGRLDALSPLKVLDRGYSLVTDAGAEGRVIRSAEQISPGQELRIRFYDGQRNVRAQ
jgi:exodeoxyribonuclease VII large subunit